MTDLHGRLLAKMDDEATGINYWVNVNPFEDAVRAVVELHTPAPGRVPGSVACCRCRHDWGGREAYPCKEVQAIASALGVEIGETP